MMKPSARRLAAAAAAIAGTLLLAAIPAAHARGANAKPSASGADGYTPKPVIRDRRKNPQQPWTLPPHYHRHDRR